MTIKFNVALNGNRQTATIADKSIYYSNPPYLQYQYSVSIPQYSLIYVTDNKIVKSVGKTSIKSRVTE